MSDHDIVDEIITKKSCANVRIDCPKCPMGGASCAGTSDSYSKAVEWKTLNPESAEPVAPIDPVCCRMVDGESIEQVIADAFELSEQRKAASIAHSKYMAESRKELLKQEKRATELIEKFNKYTASK